jgi:hypothetical protein
MTEQLPATILSGALAPGSATDTYDRAGADRRCRRAGRLALCRVLRRQHSQCEHAPRLSAGVQPVLQLVRGPRPDVDRHSAVQWGGVD